MVDLRTQYQKIKSDIDNGIAEVIDSTAFVKGGKVTEFQQNLEKYLGVRHVIPVGNGTDALQIALMALGLKPGDEVITPTFTFIATAEVVALLGLTPVVVDVDKDTFCIDLDSLRRAITPKTKAIVPVHLFGQNANMEELMAIAKEHNLKIIEDCAQCIGGEYKGTKVGLVGDVGCYSFCQSIYSKTATVHTLALSAILVALRSFHRKTSVATATVEHSLPKTTSWQRKSPPLPTTACVSAIITMLSV